MYNIGDCFRIDDGIGNKDAFILAEVDYFMVQLIGLESGNRWSDKYPVEDVNKISESIIDFMVNGTTVEEDKEYAYTPISRKEAFKELLENS